MGKKLTFQEVKEYIESNGFILLDNTYVNDHTKLQLKCPAGHTFSIILNSFKQGRRCSVCKGIETTKRQRTPYEIIVKKVNEIGRRIITTREEYEQGYSKENKFFIIECICGGPHKTTLDRLKKKCLCKECSNEKTGKRCRTPIEDVINLIKSKGFILASTDYKNYGSKLEVICDKGHVFYPRYADLKIKNSGCSVCKGDSVSKHNRMPYDDLTKIAEEKNLKILTSSEIYDQNFKGKAKRISVQCLACEHSFLSTPGRINYGIGCQMCGYKKSADKRRYTYEEAATLIEKAGYRLISKAYEGNQKLLTVLCLEHGEFEIRLNDILSGHRCGKCALTYTKAQLELYDFIKNFYSDALWNTRKIISPKELDIYIPSINLAIEYCGLYWHNEEKKDNDYHCNKMKQCNKKGLRLITIFEDEWINRKAQVKNFILSAINKNSIKIMARKTELREVNKKEAALFLEQNHIQGKTFIEIAFGLYYNNELQAIITGNKHHRQGHGNQLVLNRLAFKNDVSIAGGSSKLLKALIAYAKENNYSSLISWSDNRYSEGNVYKKLGFELIEELPPDYSYVNFKKTIRLSKQSCKKKELLRKGAKGDMYMTERELALSLNLYRIWDCGKKRWEIKL